MTISLLTMLWLATIVVNFLDYLDGRQVEPESICSRGAALFVLTIAVHFIIIFSGNPR